MTTDGDNLFVTVGGRDIGLEELLRRVDAEMQQSANRAVQLGQSYARLAQAQGQPAAASQILAGTIARSGAASERAILGIETQAAKLANSSTLMQQFGQSAASSLVGLAGPAALASTAISGLIAVGQSFGDAFALKAELDATTLAINAQLKGVRDSGQVWDEAAAFANRYKLTQEETTNAISASIGVMRASKAPIEDILGVLARMQVLSPEQSLQEAAIALKALASGDTQSLVTRFEVSRDTANQMKAEIQGGADAVQVMSRFLTETGIGMDVLAAKTEGVSGKMKDLAVAQEDLALAQAKWAEGPGLAILETRISALSGLTRILTGDFDAMGQSVQNTGAAFSVSGAWIGAYVSALASGKNATEAQAAATEAATAATQAYGQAQVSGGGGTWGLTDAITAQTTAISAASQALVDETQKKLDSAQAAERLRVFQADLASLGGQVAGGLSTAGAAAERMASQYNIATGEALRLVQAQAALAQAKVNAAALAEQRAGERSPGSSGVAEAAAQEQARLNAIYKRLVVPEPKKAKGGGGGGGGARLTDQQKLQNQLISSQEQYNQRSAAAETDHQQRLLDIQQQYAERRKEAEESFAQSQLEGRAGFYDSLGSIEDTGLRSALAAQYEAAFQEADRIAQEKGADVGERFLEAKQQALQSQAKRASEIAEAQKQGDEDKAEYLAGVDKLYREAEDRKLKAIAEGNDSLAAQQQAQLDQEAANYAQKQAEIGASADSAAARKIAASERAGQAIDAEGLKVDQLTGKYNTLGAAGSRAGIVPQSGSAPVTATPAVAPTAAAPQAASSQPGLAELISSLMGKLDEVKTAIVAAETRGADQVAGAVKNLRGAVS